jgi:hypothetical protein
MLASALGAFPFGIVLAAFFAVTLAAALNLYSIVAAVSLLPPYLLPLVNFVLAAPFVGNWFAFLVALTLWFLVTFALYWIASVNVTLPANGGLVSVNGTENWARGSMIGICAGANFFFLMLLFGAVPSGAIVAVVIPLIGLASASPVLSNNPIMQIVIGWSALLMPMAWPMTFVGWIAFAINSAVLALGLAPLVVIPLWTRGNLIMHGGVVHGCYRTLFNLGNFTSAHGDVNLAAPWFDKGTVIWPFCSAAFASPPGVQRFSVLGVALHESSHELNLAAFGWIYHLIGFADETAPMPWSSAGPLGADAHAELCAESGLRAFGRNFLDQWLPAPPPPSGPAPAANTPAIPALAPVATPGVVPIAVAGSPADPTIVACAIGAVATFTSAGSADPDRFPTPIGRLWRVEEPRPAGASASVTGTVSGADTDVEAEYVPDVGGVHLLSMTVTDGADGETMSIEIHALQAIADTPVSPVALGAPVTLNGAASIGVATTPLNMSWEVTGAPAGSTQDGLALVGATPSFTPDSVGSYVIDFTVSSNVSPAGGGAPVLIRHVVRITFDVV